MVVENGLIMTVLDHLEPSEVKPRYISHATYSRAGYSYRIEGNELWNLVNHDIAYFDCDEVRVFYNMAFIILDAQEEYEHIKYKVGNMIDVKWGGLNPPSEN